MKRALDAGIAVHDGFYLNWVLLEKECGSVWWGD